MTPEELASLGDLQERRERISKPLALKIVNAIQEHHQACPELSPCDVTIALIITLVSHIGTVRDRSIPTAFIAQSIGRSVESEMNAAFEKMLPIEAAQQPAG